MLAKRHKFWSSQYEQRLLDRGESTAVVKHSVLLKTYKRDLDFYNDTL